MTDAYRNELFSSIRGKSTTDFAFTDTISHRAEVKSNQRQPSEVLASVDTAEAMLKSQMASIAKEKQANQTTITDSILPAPKNKYEALKQQKLNNRNGTPGSRAGSAPVSPSVGAITSSRLGTAPTSAPMSDISTKTQAMRFALVHLLAVRPVTIEVAARKTHIPNEDLNEMLQKVGKGVDGKWALSERAAKELDVWRFEYKSDDDRQAAIDNAIKAYDRLRLSKDDKLWQMLLPKEKRGKGIVLSRLNLGAGQGNQGLTPHWQPSPMPHGDGAGDSRATSAANTPLPGGSTPRLGGSKGDITKRLLSKDPKKARAAAEEKERKRKRVEAGASDAEGDMPTKTKATKKAVPKVKSAAVVFSSDEDEPDAAKTKKTAANTKSTDATSRPKRKLEAMSSPDDDDVDHSSKPSKTSKLATKPTGSSMQGRTATAKAAESGVVKASTPLTKGRDTPQAAGQKISSAPSTALKVQSSPRKLQTRTNVPSPLGAARPRVASDESERSTANLRIAKSGEATPKGLGITTEKRKRHDTHTTSASESEGSLKKKPISAQDSARPSASKLNGSQASFNGNTSTRPGASIKQKAADLQESTSPSAKHRKVGSGSSASQKSDSGSTGTPSDTTRTSHENLRLTDSSSTNATDGAITHSMSYRQGVREARKFLETLYPAYAKKYDEQAAAEARGEKVDPDERRVLLNMHARLEEMKREIAEASRREREREREQG